MILTVKFSDIDDKNKRLVTKKKCKKIRMKKIKKARNYKYKIDGQRERQIE